MANPIDTQVVPGAQPSDQPAAQNGTPQREYLTAFDPADWLARYTALGGVYVANGKLNLCILVNSQTEEQLSQIRQMVVDLTDDGKAAILAHIASEPAYAPVTWQDVVAKYATDEAALGRHPYARTHPDAPEYEALDLEHQALAVRSTESLRKLIETPAPDPTALCRKIKIILKEYGETDGLFGTILADVERLGQQTVAAPAPDADSAILAAWERRRVAYAEIDALPETEGTTAKEEWLWAQARAADEIIRSHVATTPAGVSVQLWAGLDSISPSHAIEGVCRRGDLAALESHESEMDCSERLMLAALRSLKSMGA